MIFLIQFDCSGLRNLNGGNIINVWLHINGCSKVCCEKLFFTGTEPPAREHRENIQAPVGSSRGWFFVSSACSATPQPEVGLERKLLERTRKTILVGLPSQPKPGSFGKLAKEQKKKLKKKKSDCWGEFASRVSRPRGFGAASECFRGYPNQARRLPLPVPVGVQPSELGCQWGYSCIRMLRSSSSFPTAVTYCPQPEELLSCCPLDHKLQVKKASPWKQLTRKPFLAFFLEISLSLILSKGHLKPSSSCPFFSSS